MCHVGDCLLLIQYRDRQQQIQQGMRNRGCFLCATKWALWNASYNARWRRKLCLSLSPRGVKLFYSLPKLTVGRHSCLPAVDYLSGLWAAIWENFIVKKMKDEDTYTWQRRTSLHINVCSRVQLIGQHLET